MNFEYSNEFYKNIPVSDLSLKEYDSAKLLFEHLIKLKKEMGNIPAALECSLNYVAWMKKVVGAAFKKTTGKLDREMDFFRAYSSLTALYYV